ncbi:MAG TPA: orotidine-5'-phosphate decarboxylase [Bacillota bacterium]|nr:orotidine-5'-phosphate decarboxylase [Bacillota bacterium]
MGSIYLALDFPTGEDAVHFLTTHNLQGTPVKVGMELFYKEGPALIEQLKKNDHPIFLDLKLHDIPTTVYRAMKNIASLGVDIVNVHALGGSAMMERAKEGLLAGNSSQSPALLAVTVLTSMDEHVLKKELHMNESLQKQVGHLASLAKSSGVDGVVCSAHEATHIKELCGPSFLTVTPGIRLANTNADDQVRVATPREAKRMGSDILVIGRSITQAESPKDALETAIKEWEYED